MSAPRLRLARGGPAAVLGTGELEGLVDELLAGLPSLERVLLIPPDFTRFHSGAGALTALLYQRLAGRGSQVEVLPATGTHAPMTQAEAARMFPGIPPEKIFAHDFRGALADLGEVPAAFVREVSRGLVDYPVPCEVAPRIVDGRFDRVLSIGQLVPHEVAGIANHSKNIFVGVGGKRAIDRTHFLGAVCGMERTMGRARGPVRDVLNYMAAELGAALPLTYVLTVRGRDPAGRLVTRGLYAGDDEQCFREGAALAQQVNIEFVPAPLRKVVVHLDPGEFRSTWLGNKAIYRTRMALADGAELLVIAPGVRTFGEDPGIDRLIRRHGYHGTPRTLAAVAADPELAGSLAAAAHLIHGSSEGRFQVTYAPGGLDRWSVQTAGFAYRDCADALRRYDPTRLADGPNTLPGGEEIFFISNPALGLWALRGAFDA